MEGGDEGVKKRSRFQNICVYCGSSSGANSSYADATIRLGKLLAERKINLVYGGSSLGLMGLISQTVFDGGCQVLGITPGPLRSPEITGYPVGRIEVVPHMHERKYRMIEYSDAFVALPGGYGTTEELLEVITWSQLGIHDKPIGVLNLDGYFNGLLGFFDTAVKDGFIKEGARQIVITADTPEELLDKMEEYEAVHDKVAPKESWKGRELLESSTSEPSSSGNPC